MKDRLDDEEYVYKEEVDEGPRIQLRSATLAYAA